MEQTHSLKNIYPRSIPCYYNVENRYYGTTKSTITSPTNGGNIRTSYKEDTRMSHIQPERLPKSKMASSDDRFTFEIVHVLRFGNELNKELCCRFILIYL